MYFVAANYLAATTLKIKKNTPCNFVLLKHTQTEILFKIASNYYFSAESSQKTIL